MPVAPLDVDPDVYLGAGAVFLQVTDTVCDVVAAAATAAGAGGGMAGTDSGGIAWASTYDAAAESALRTGAELATSLGLLGGLLARSGTNHVEAETASTAGGPPSYPGDGGGGAAAPSVIPATPPSANATDDDPPAGWFLVAHLLEYTWPNGHQDRLRRVADGWTTAARGLSDAADRLTGAVADVSGLRSPEVDAAVATCRRVQDATRSLAQAFSSLGGSCRDYASYLDDAHSGVIGELVEFAAESAAIQILGALAAVPTAGGSEVAGQTAQAARTALAASRIARVLRRLLELVEACSGTVRAVADHVQGVHTQLHGVLAKGGTAAVAVVAAAAAVQPYDLAAAEAAGGHTLLKHVGRTDQQLIDRDIPLASTFPDQPTAEVATGLNLAAHADDIATWLSGTDRRLQITTPSPGLTGRVYVRQSGTFVAPTSVTTVLRRSANGYFVVTSYPDV